VKVSSTIRQIPTFLALVMLVAITLAMAWPRLLSSLQFLPVQQAKMRLYQADAAQKVDLDSLQARTQNAISYHDAYAYHSAASLLAYVSALDTKASLYSRQQMLSESTSEAKLALAGAPLQPDLWLRLAQAGAKDFVPAAQLIDYFHMAVWSGRVEPTHLIARLHIGFSLVQLLDADGLNLLRDQVLLAWNLKRTDMQRALRGGQLNYRRVVDLMLPTHPDVVREMEEIVGPVTL